MTPNKAPAAPPISGNSEVGQDVECQLQSNAQRVNRAGRESGIQCVPEAQHATLAEQHVGRDSAKMIMMPICDIRVIAKPLLKNAGSTRNTSAVSPRPPSDQG